MEPLMKPLHRPVLTVFFATIFAVSGMGQVDEICTEFGYTPSLDSPFAQVPYIFGHVLVKDGQAGSRSKVTVSLVDPSQAQKRLTVEKSGNYCFKRTGNSSGTLVIEVDGVEVARRSYGSFGATQLREDFEVSSPSAGRSSPPSPISAKFSHPPNDKTLELYRKAAQAERSNDARLAMELVNEIVKADPADFVAWAKLGALHFDRKAYVEAEGAFRKAITLKPEYTPAWINAGKIRIAQKQYEAAIEVFKHIISIDPTLARAHQLLGESYLMTKQGTFGVEALNNALVLDPIGMADCHLQLAHLYELAGAKPLAAKEYAEFLKKRPGYSDKKKLEKFIKDNPAK